MHRNSYAIKDMLSQEKQVFSLYLLHEKKKDNID